MQRELTYRDGGSINNKTVLWDSTMTLNHEFIYNLLQVVIGECIISNMEDFA